MSALVMSGGHLGNSVRMGLQKPAQNRQCRGPISGGRFILHASVGGSSQPLIWQWEWRCWARFANSSELKMPPLITSQHLLHLSSHLAKGIITKTLNTPRKFWPIKYCFYIQQVLVHVAYFSSCWLSSWSLKSSSSTRCPNGSDEMETMFDRITLLSLLPVKTSWSWEWLYLTLQTLEAKSALKQSQSVKAPYTST